MGLAYIQRPAAPLSISLSNMTDYFDAYFSYAGVGESEAPTIFHRWASVSIIGALLARRIWLPFGHSHIYPNQYVMFMGSAGTRKSTAINIGAKLLKGAGYSSFAADRVSKEKFLMMMSSIHDEALDDPDALLELTLDEPAESYIVAEEFTDFTGINNMEFYTMLTKLWDCPSEYLHPKIHGKDVEVNKPTVNILSGNTAQGFALAFPAEALGNGFLSRVILVYGETTGRKVTFPKPIEQSKREVLLAHLQEVKRLRGECQLTDEAKELCDRIYKEYLPLDDSRFVGYANRRFTHLLKLAMVIAATRLSVVIEGADVIKANTLLYVTELKMPRALGEFGKSKYSDVASTIIDILHAAKRPVTVNELWKKTQKDFNKLTEFHEVLKNLQQAEKIQTMKLANIVGFVPCSKPAQEWKEELLQLGWLTLEELE